MHIHSVLTKIIALTFLIFSAATVLAQGDIEMADRMRSEGKIYVVVAVISVVFLGLAVYLITLDRRISKMEKEKENQ